MKVFVPWSEELAESHPHLVTAPVPDQLVPYQVGMRCAHLASDGGSAPAGGDRPGESRRDREPSRQDAA